MDTTTPTGAGEKQVKAEVKRERRASQVKAARAPKEKPAQQTSQQAVTPSILEQMRAEIEANVRQDILSDLNRLMPERGASITGRSMSRQREMPYREQRQPVREPVRQQARVVLDREGNPITRRPMGDSSDPFAIPDDLREKDWDYQWCRISTYGQEDISNQVNMQEAGWRPILAERAGWRGRFMPAEYKGPINKDGLMLMERPMILTEEARAETDRAYREQKQQQRGRFGLNLPDGFTAATDRARAATGVKVGRPEAMRDLQPQHQLADGLEY